MSPSSVLRSTIMVVVMGHALGSNNASSSLSSLQYYSALSASANHTRIGNVDVYDGGDVSVCHMVNFDFPSHLNVDPRSRAQAAAGFALALQHLNTADDSVIPELGNLNCGGLKFAAERLGSVLYEYEAVDAVMQTMVRDVRRPCVFTGAANPEVTKATAALTGIHAYPQVSPHSVSSSELDGSEQYPLLVSLSPSTARVTTQLLDYLFSTLGLRFLIIAQSDDSSHKSITNHLVAHASEVYPTLDIKVVTVSPHSYGIAESVKNIKSIGSRYVLTYLNDDHFEAFMVETFNRGIGEEYVWISTSTTLVNETLREFAPGDPFFLATKGMLHFGSDKNPPSSARYDDFVEALEQVAKNDEALEYLRMLQPGAPIIDQSIGTTILDETPLMFDMTILAGMAACRAGVGGPFSGEQHYQAMLNTTFLGASGRISLDPATGSREVATQRSSIHNLQPIQLANGLYAINATKVASYFDGAWKQEQTIVFSDGTSDLPPALPVYVLELNFIGPGLRSIGFTWASLVVGASLAACVWTIVYRRRSLIIRASQPIFLLFIGLGTALMGASILPLAIDDEIVIDPPCMAFPWLFVMGWCFAFSALFSKTMRVNKIFHQARFARIQVSPRDVMIPMACLLGGAYLAYECCLRLSHGRITVNLFFLSAWTLMDPLRWKRSPVEKDQFDRTIASLGTCKCQHFYVFFAPLAIVNIGVLIFANHQAYVARKISTEFAETDHISRSMSLIATSAFIAIPVGIIAQDNKRASFFVQAGFVFVVCMAILVHIFVPKILYKKEKNSFANAIRSSMMSPDTTLRTDLTESDGDTVLAHPSLCLQMHRELLQLRQEKLNHWKAIDKCQEDGTECSHN